MNTQIDFEQARLNMIEQQIRTWEVLDQDVLDLIYQVHREDFVPSNYKQLALADTNIPLANGQVMMTPKLEARVLQAVALQKNDRVLEIGTGSAYLTALIAKKVQQLDSVDIFADFTNDALAKLENYQIENVQLHTGDVLSNWKNQTSYDVIIITGSMSKLDQSLQDDHVDVGGRIKSGTFIEQLTEAGRLFAIVGKSPVMEARLITRVGDKEWSSEILFETDLPALIGAEEAAPFQF
jgi:protein-L-isoaspartate(D-aspartate) O-methyltransferase